MRRSRISGADVRRYLAARITACRPGIDERLSSVVPGMRLRTVLPHFTNTLSVEDYPAVLCEQLSENARWEAMPDLLRREFRIAVWGLVHYDEKAMMDDLVAELATGVFDALVSRHEPVRLEGVEGTVYFDSVVPVGQITYGAGQMQRTLVHGFNAEFACHVLQSAPDERPQTSYSLDPL